MPLTPGPLSPKFVLKAAMVVVCGERGEARSRLLRDSGWHGPGGLEGCSALSLGENRHRGQVFSQLAIASIPRVVAKR